MSQWTKSKTRTILTVLSALGCAIALGAQAAPSPVADPLTAAERAEVFKTVQSGVDQTEAPLGAIDDATLLASLERYARTELGQRLRPSAIDRFWAIEPPSIDVVAAMQDARAKGRLAEWAASLAPPYAAYRALQSARCRYRDLVDGGGWRPLPAGPALKAGAAGPNVAALRTRLAAEGYLSVPLAQPEQFDAGLVAALSLFQTGHGLAADGTLGSRTRAALDIPAEQRLAQIDANLERWRWLPRPLPPERLEVDIAQAEATLYERGAPALRMRVVVGDPRHRTPMFASALQGLVFNPPWNVPASIATKEIAPKAARDPGYLARNHFSYVDGHLQQSPGEHNSLGRLKFELNSPFGVYLHDTPSRAAFARDDRALSHGCMRLEKPRELAQSLLGWSAGQVDAQIAAGATTRTPLPRKTPLFVVYRTAAVGDDGGLEFRADVYGWDAKLNQALAHASGFAAIAPTDTECASVKR